MLVLYAEDDFDDLETFREILAKVAPYATCLNARNGIEALEFLDNAIVLPDLIFLDINMPIMDGRACLKELKKDERFNSIPVVIYTTSNDVRDKELCMQLGATDYILKANNIKQATDNLSEFFKKM